MRDTIFNENAGRFLNDQRDPFDERNLPEL